MAFTPCCTGAHAHPNAAPIMRQVNPGLWVQNASHQKMPGIPATEYYGSGYRETPLTVRLEYQPAPPYSVRD